MKKVLLIALALISCLAAEAQLRTIKPKWTYKVPNISGATYLSRGCSDPYNLLFEDFYADIPLEGEVDNIIVSSTLRPQGSKNYRATNLHDRNHETAWVEGVKGYGIGQWIEYQGTDGCFGEGFPVVEIRILNGYVKSDKAWRENSRVKRLKVYCNGKPKCILELQNSRSLQAFNVKGLFSAGATIRFEILDVYPGTKYQDTVISEIYFP